MYKCCQAEGCGSVDQPYYGYEDSDWQNCAIHKLSDMIRLDPQCAMKNCQHLPQYGSEGEVPRHCQYHMTETDIWSKGCLAAGCDGIRLYGFMDGVNQFCEAHKLDEMVVLLHGLPDYDGEEEEEEAADDGLGAEGEPESAEKAVVILQEADDDLVINIDDQPEEESEKYDTDSDVEIVEPGSLCNIEGCVRAGHYAMGQKMVCTLHKQEGMLLKSSEQLYHGCERKGCSRSASFGFHEGNPRLCLLHKMQGMLFFPAIEISARMQQHLGSKNANGAKKRAYIKRDPYIKKEKRPKSYCETPGCTSNAIYGSGSIPTHCNGHKTESMRYFTRLKLCVAEGCGKYADYGNPGEKARFCKDHASEGMEITSHLKLKYPKHKKCAAEGCEGKAQYGMPKGPREYCFEHKTDEMVSSSTKVILREERKCKMDGCTKHASFGYKENPFIFCHLHRREDMWFRGQEPKPKPPKKGRPRCETPMCPRRATFGYVGMKLQLCNRHALPEMEYLALLRKGKREWCGFQGCRNRAQYDINGKTLNFCMKHSKPAVARTCSFEGCEGQRIFGYPNQFGGKRYCPLHKHEGMVPGKNMCKHPEGCQRKATWGYVEAPKLRCPVHKMMGMVLCKNQSRKIKFCRAENCTVTASYGFEENPRVYCATHRQDGMVHHSTREICETEGCVRRRYFGFKGEPRRFCSIHKLDGMQSRKTRKYCESPGCPKQPRYGFKGKVRRFCLKHKLDGMTSISKCQIEECEKTPHFGEPGQSKRTRCFDHKNETMVYHPKPGVPGGAAIRKSAVSRARSIAQKTVVYSKPTLQGIQEPLPPDQKDLVWRQLAMCQPGMSNPHYSMQQQSQLVQQLQQNAALRGQHYLY